MGKKKNKISKRDRCKGCGNKQVYIDKDGRKRFFCIAFEVMYMNTDLNICPLEYEDKKEVWRRYGYTLEEEDFCPYVKITKE